jgi:hypothetical protein
MGRFVIETRGGQPIGDTMYHGYKGDVRSVDGVLRDNAIIDGSYVDHIIMSMLEKEYFAIYNFDTTISSDA